MSTTNYYQLPRNYRLEGVYDTFQVRPPHARSVEDSYEEFKKILILAGAFFFILIVVIMSKLQVGTEEVLRWSPVVWLFGVIVAGGIMNLLCYLQKKYKERKRRRRHNAEALLYSLPIPSSFPCLAPPPHIDCCRDQRHLNLPSYDEAVRAKLQGMPPSYDTAIALVGHSDSPPPFNV